DDELLEKKESPLARVTDLKGFPSLYGDKPKLPGDSYFLRTSLQFDSVARSRDWYRYATTPELVQSLADPSNNSERLDVGVFLHGRILRPLLSLTLMMVSLPLVLSGYGRNMFINLGLSLGVSALFYASCFLASYLGEHEVFSAELSAWAPLIG